MNKNGLRNIFKSSFSTKTFRRNKKPSDIVLKEKIEPKFATNLSDNPEIVESIYSEIMTQPRSKLKLPVKQLIRPKLEDDTKYSKVDLLEPISEADSMLEKLRNDSTKLVPRLETINQVSKALAIVGSWEKAESLILNMKNDCKIHEIFLNYLIFNNLIF